MSIVNYVIVYLQSGQAHVVQVNPGSIWALIIKNKFFKDINF